MEVDLQKDDLRSWQPRRLYEIPSRFERIPGGSQLSPALRNSLVLLPCSCPPTGDPHCRCSAPTGSTTPPNSCRQPTDSSPPPAVIARPWQGAWAGAGEAAITLLPDIPWSFCSCPKRCPFPSLPGQEPGQALACPSRWGTEEGWFCSAQWSGH